MFAPIFLQILELQATLFLLILAGLLLCRLGILDQTGQQYLSDLTIRFIIPCNIFKSFLIPLDASVLQSCGVVLLIGAVLQMMYLFLSPLLFRRFSPVQQKILQYATLCTNAGFLGNSVAQGLYGSLGLLYTSVHLIPMRMTVWSIGTSYFVTTPGEKRSYIKLLRHPCLVAIFLGMFFMLTRIPLPSVLTQAVGSAGACTAPMTMLLIGSILARVDLRTIFSWGTCYFCAIRLVLFPLGVFLLCRALSLDTLTTGVAVLMTGMPAGSTTALFAATYHCDPPFAVKVTVSSILLSMITLPLWRLAVG